MKNTHFYVVLMLFCCTLASHPHVSLEPTRDYIDDEEEIGFFDFDGGDVPDLDIEMKDNCPGLTVFEVVDAATNPNASPVITIQNTLKLQLYNFTNPPVIRSLLSNPVLLMGRINPEEGCNRFSTKLFYKEMRKSFLTPCSPFLSSYLAIFTDPELIAEIDRLGGIFGENLDIPAVFDLFRNIKLEERRTGFILGYGRRECDSRWEWRVFLPLYYFEHNFYLTECEQNAIKNDPFFKRPENPDDDPDDGPVKEFAMAHLVNDALGFGDMKNIITYDIITDPNLIVTLGMEVDLPTALALADHIIGGRDCKTGKKISACPNQPPFNLFGLICLAQKSPNGEAEAQDAGYQFAVGALDRLTEILAQAPLGTRRVDIAGTIEWFLALNSNVTWRNKIKLSYQTPVNEKRFLRSTKNPADFNRDFGNPALAEENNRFLSEQIVLFFYPPLVSVHSHQGITVQYTTGLTLDYECYRWDIGYDYWSRARESFKVISAPVPVDCCEGIRPRATQNKLWTILSLDHQDSCRYWRFGLFGDITVASKGIGKDWCAGIDFSVLF